MVGQTAAFDPLRGDPSGATRPRDDNAGFTLVELLVVLLLLGILAGVSVAALPRLSRPARPTTQLRLEEARRTSIASGHDVILKIADPVSGAERRWRFLPDGRGVGPGIDPRNGMVVDSTIGAEVLP